MGEIESARELKKNTGKLDKKTAEFIKGTSIQSNHIDMYAKLTTDRIKDYNFIFIKSQKKALKSYSETWSKCVPHEKSSLLISPYFASLEQREQKQRAKNYFEKVEEGWDRDIHVEHIDDVGKKLRITEKNPPLLKTYFKVIETDKRFKLETIYKDRKFSDFEKGLLFKKEVINKPFKKVESLIGIDTIKRHSNAKIYFVLDGLNIVDAVRRISNDKAHHYSALHHIYNDWENLKKKVLFFEGNQRVHAPWEKNPELWSSRKRGSESQNKDQNPRALKDLIEEREIAPPPAKKQRKTEDKTLSIENVRKRFASQRLDVPPETKKAKISHSR